MEAVKRKFEVSELYRLCNKEMLFTCGSINQYDAMFELAGSGVTQSELAYMLYFCSDLTLNSIYDIVRPLFVNFAEWA
jgi:hypothetical protein